MLCALVNNSKYTSTRYVLVRVKSPTQHIYTSITHTHTHTHTHDTTHAHQHARAYTRIDIYYYFPTSRTHTSTLTHPPTHSPEDRNRFCGKHCTRKHIIIIIKKHIIFYLYTCENIYAHRQAHTRANEYILYIFIYTQTHTHSHAHTHTHTHTHI